MARLALAIGGAAIAFGCLAAVAHGAGDSGQGRSSLPLDMLPNLNRTVPAAADDAYSAAALAGSKDGKKAEHGKSDQAKVSQGKHPPKAEGAKPPKPANNPVTISAQHQPAEPQADQNQPQTVRQPAASLEHHVAFSSATAEGPGQSSPQAATAVDVAGVQVSRPESGPDNPPDVEMVSQALGVSPEVVYVLTPAEEAQAAQAGGVGPQAVGTAGMQSAPPQTAPAQSTPPQPVPPQTAQIPLPSFMPTTGKPLLDFGILGTVSSMLVGAGLAATRLGRRR